MQAFALSLCSNVQVGFGVIVYVFDRCSFSSLSFLDKKKKKKKHLETHTGVRTRAHARTHTQIDNNTQTHKFVYIKYPALGAPHSEPQILCVFYMTYACACTDIHTRTRIRTNKHTHKHTFKQVHIYMQHMTYA